MALFEGHVWPTRAVKTGWSLFVVSCICFILFYFFSYSIESAAHVALFLATGMRGRGGRRSSGSSLRKVRPRQLSRVEWTRGADTRVPPLGGGREGEGRVIEVEAGGGNVLLVRQRRAKVVRPVEPSQEQPASPPLLRETGRIRFAGMQRTNRNSCVKKNKTP